MTDSKRSFSDKGLDLPSNTLFIIQNNLEIVESGIELIDDKSIRLAFRQILSDHKERILTAPGSRHNHQAWQGGYIGHIAETFTIGHSILETYPDRFLPFTISDFLLVMFLHDIEKPFAYSFDENGNIISNENLREKPAKKKFRESLIKEYGIILTQQQEIALTQVEKIPEDQYSPHERTMTPLGALCHASDTLSARLWYDYPKY